MSGNRPEKLDSFVDGLFDDDEVAPVPQGRGTMPNPVVARVTQPMGTVMPVRAVVAGQHQNAPSVAPHGLASLGGGQVAMGKPSTMPTFTPGALNQGMVGQVGAGGARVVASNQPALIPAHTLPSSVPSTGFASNLAIRPTTGGLSGLQSKGTAQMGVSTAAASRVVPGASIVPGASVSTAKLPVGGQTMPLPGTPPQPVSAKASNAALSRPVSSTSVPAPKKQMTSESGASRARNADGSLKDENGGDEEDEELISRDFEETTAEPIRYGSSTLTEEGKRRERSKDEERKLVNAEALKNKMDSICIKSGLRASPKVADIIALALHQRLVQVMDTMVKFSKRRMDLEGDTGASNIVRSSNPRLYLKEQETKRNEERDKRIAEKLAAESGTSALDPSALRRQEEEMNATVLDFAGPARRPRSTLTAKIDPSTTSTGPSMSNQMHVDGGGAASGFASIKERNRRVTLGDALKFMRQDMHSKHSQLTLNTMAGLKIPEAYVGSGSVVRSTVQSSGGGGGGTYYPSSIGAPTTISGGITTRSSANSTANAQRHPQLPTQGHKPAVVMARPSTTSTPASVSTAPIHVVAVQSPLNSVAPGGNTRSQSKPSLAPTAKR